MHAPVVSIGVFVRPISWVNKNVDHLGTQRWGGVRASKKMVQSYKTVYRLAM